MSNKCPACGEDFIPGAENCENCGYTLEHLSLPRARTLIDKSFHKKPVSELRRHDAIVVPRGRKVQDVLASMVLRQDGCAVVADDEGKVAGIFSERDLLMRVVGIDHSLMDRPVEDVMTVDPVTIQADAPVAYALHQMVLGGYRHLPLVEDDKPVGMISVRDIVNFICDRFMTHDEPQ